MGTGFAERTVQQGGTPRGRASRGQAPAVPQVVLRLPDLSGRQLEPPDGAVAGFAFQLAMEYLSPTIGSVLSKMDAAARFINTQLNVAPCQTGMPGL